MLISLYSHLCRYSFVLDRSRLLSQLMTSATDGRRWVLSLQACAGELQPAVVAGAGPGVPGPALLPADPYAAAGPAVRRHGRHAVAPPHRPPTPPTWPGRAGVFPTRRPAAVAATAVRLSLLPAGPTDDPQNQIFLHFYDALRVWLAALVGGVLWCSYLFNAMRGERLSCVPVGEAVWAASGCRHRSTPWLWNTVCDTYWCRSAGGRRRRRPAVRCCFQPLLCVTEGSERLRPGGTEAEEGTTCFGVCCYRVPRACPPVSAAGGTHNEAHA